MTWIDERGTGEVARGLKVLARLIAKHELSKQLCRTSEFGRYDARCAVSLEGSVCLEDSICDTYMAKVIALAERQFASMDDAAKRFVEVHERHLAMVLAAPRVGRNNGYYLQENGNEEKPWMDEYPMEVVSFVRNEKFPETIPEGTPIRRGSCINDSRLFQHDMGRGKEAPFLLDPPSSLTYATQTLYLEEKDMVLALMFPTPKFKSARAFLEELHA